LVGGVYPERERERERVCVCAFGDLQVEAKREDISRAQAQIAELTDKLAAYKVVCAGLLLCVCVGLCIVCVSGVECLAMPKQ
jgi:hypothetical protein